MYVKIIIKSDHINLKNTSYIEMIIDEEETKKYYK